MSEPYLIDTFDDGLVVIPLAEAQRLATLNRALRDSTTWEEFLAAVADDAQTVAYLDERFEDEPPGAEDPFDAQAIPGFGDYWPTWPKQAMLEWLPESVLQLGSVAATAMSGDFLQLDETLIEDVIAALAAEGIDAHEDSENLVTMACGAWMYGL